MFFDRSRCLRMLYKSFWIIPAKTRRVGAIYTLFWWHFEPYSYGSIIWHSPGRSPPLSLSYVSKSPPSLRNPMIPEYHVTPFSSCLCRYILWKARRTSLSSTHGAWAVIKKLPNVVRWCVTICMRVIVWGRHVTPADLDVTETLLTIVKKTVACWEFFCCFVFLFFLLLVNCYCWDLAFSLLLGHPSTSGEHW
jgi:hypothetical protein